jgi:hypothetical protein
MVVTYHIEKVQLIRQKEGEQWQSFSYKTSEFIVDLDVYRNNLKEKFGVSRINLTYTKIEQR